MGKGRGASGRASLDGGKEAEGYCGVGIARAAAAAAAPQRAWSGPGREGEEEAAGCSLFLETVKRRPRNHAICRFNSRRCWAGRVHIRARASHRLSQSAAAALSLEKTKEPANHVCTPDPDPPGTKVRYNSARSRNDPASKYSISPTVLLHVVSPRRVRSHPFLAPSLDRSPSFIGIPRGRRCSGGPNTEYAIREQNNPLRSK